MPILDPDDVRAFARRDRATLERLERVRRVHAPVEEKVRLAIALYEAARATLPGWATDADRMQDLAHHIRMRRLPDRTGDLKPR